MPAQRRVFTSVLLGCMLIQAAWILALPAFRGIDEFDHVFKAESVARGEWLPQTPAADGRGSLVTVDADTARAAGPICQWYEYVGRDNCSPVAIQGRDATIASAAAAYNPVYYLLVGHLASPFSGEQSVFAMRVITAFLCALLLAWGATLVASLSHTREPVLAFLIGLTPVLLYSSTVAAPNGLHLAGASLVWAALLVVEAKSSRQAYAALGTGAVVMLTTHSTGPVWLFFIVATFTLLHRPRASWQLLLGTWRARLTALSIGFVAALCILWTRRAHTNVLPATTEGGTEVPLPGAGRIVEEMVLWMFQAIAAFPIRNQPAPAIVYIAWGTLLLLVLVLIARRGTAAEQLATTALLVLGLALPLALTIVSYGVEGFLWQGRYTLPLYLGVTAIAARVLVRTPAHLGPPALLLLAGAASVAASTSVVVVARREMSEGISPPPIDTVPGGLVLIGVLAVVGTCLPVLSHPLRRLGGRSEGPADSHSQVDRAQDDHQ